MTTSQTSPTPVAALRRLRPSIGWKRYRHVGIITALILLLIGIPAVLLKVRSSYTAESIFQVAPAYQKNLSADKELELQSNSQYREFVNHLSRSILRYDVLERALDALDLRGIDPKLPSEDKRKWIERHQKIVYVFAVPDTYMVRVGINSDIKENLHDIVNAIMDSFLETTRNEQIYGSDERGRVLAQRAALIRGEITDIENRRSALAEFLGLTTFGENTTNPYDQTLALAREKLALASTERSRAQATLNAFDRHREIPAVAGRSVLEMRLQDNGLQAMRNEVIKRNEELVRSVAGLQESHPARKPAAEEQADLGRRLQDKETEFDQSALANTRSRLLATLEQTQQVERDLAERVHQLQSQASQFASTFREANRLTGELKKREQEIADMRTRVNYLETESNALGFARLIAPALPAITPQGIGKTKMLLALLTACMALTLLIPTALDYFDRRIITVGDAEKAMHIGSAAWFVDVQDRATHVLSNDQLRRFASTLRRNHARGAHNVFSFSSVMVGGGTSSIVLHLARTLTELGTRTLVVDANSLSTDSPMLADRPGLTDVMVGKLAAEDAVVPQPHFGMRLNVVSYGQSISSGIKRLDVFRKALETWRQEFDMVLIDIPPLLPSSDAELLIDSIGQVFLVVEAEVQNKADVVRARIQLERMDPNAVGLVVNRVPVESGGETVKAQLVETITRGRFQHFMSASGLSLRWNLLLLQVQRWTQRKPPRVQAERTRRW